MDLHAIDTYLDRARRENDLTMRPCSLVTDAFLPLPAHKVGVAHLFLRPRMVLADPTGCGKTPQTLVAYGYLKEKQPQFKLLAVCGKSSQFQWRDAVHKFMRGVTATVIGYDDHKNTLSPAARRATFDPQAAITHGVNAIEYADVWVTTYAMLAKEEALILPALQDFAVAFDEVHHVDNRKQAVLYPACARVAQKAKCAWGLSATPMDNGKIDEVYSLFELLRPGMLGPYPEFRRLYYVLKLVRPMWKDKKTGQRARPFYEVRGTQNLDHLAARIDKFYLRRPADAIKAGLPPITFQIDHVELEKAQRDVYDSIVEGEWPGTKTKLDQLAALTRAQQALDAPEIIGFKQVGNAKATRLLERLQHDLVGQKVIVYSKYVEVVRVLEAKLTAAKVAHVRVTGEDTLRARDTARARFSGDPSVNVILVTDAGGESLDLQAASTVVLYDLPWTHGSFTQVIGRARRIGSTHPNVLTVLLVGAPNTLDGDIAENLTNKERTIQTVIQQGPERLAQQLHAQLPHSEEQRLLEQLFHQGGV